MTELPLPQLRTQATLTCPQCGAKQGVEMPLNACQYFYKCTSCGAMLKPKEGECCVFCSYADTQCPPKQLEKNPMLAVELEQ